MAIGKLKQMALDQDTNDPEKKQGNQLDPEELRELLARATMLIDQVNGLFNMYISGVQDTPPNVQRQNLERIMAKVSAAAKPTPNLKFRFNSLHNRYITYRDRWDKLLKDLEEGKISRRNRNEKKIYRT